MSRTLPGRSQSSPDGMICELGTQFSVRRMLDPARAVHVNIVPPELSSRNGFVVLHP